MMLHVAALSDMGRQRSQNEDAFLLWDLARAAFLRADDPATLDDEGAAYLLVVSDGMGGACSGDVASQTAIESLRTYATKAFRAGGLPTDGPNPVAWLTEGISETNRDVYVESRADVSRHGMGATITAAGVFERELVVAHVGDTRAYLLRRGRLRQLTTDHTHVQELVSIGRISVEEARTHRDRNILRQAIGTDDSVDVDGLDIAVDESDRLLLCSDGLHGLVEDREIAEVLDRDRTPAEQCRTLVTMANQRGGPDNVTVVVAHLR